MKGEVHREGDGRNFACVPCGVWCSNPANYDAHVRTRKHATALRLARFSGQDGGEENGQGGLRSGSKGGYRGESHVHAEGEKDVMRRSESKSYDRDMLWGAFSSPPSKRGKPKHPTGKQRAHMKANNRGVLRTIECKFFRRGRCPRGDACTFKHTPSSRKRERSPSAETGTHTAGQKGKHPSQVPCKYFNKGNCRNGDACLFRHTRPNKRPRSPPYDQEGSLIHSGEYKSPPSAPHIPQEYVSGRFRRCAHSDMPAAREFSSSRSSSSAPAAQLASRDDAESDLPILSSPAAEAWSAKAASRFLAQSSTATASEAPIVSEALMAPEAPIIPEAPIVPEGDMVEVPESFMSTAVSRSDWRQLREHVFNTGTSADILAFKLLQELLLSPSVGLPLASLGPLDMALCSLIPNHMSRSCGGKVIAKWSDFPHLLLEPDAIHPWPSTASADEQAALALAGRNLRYIFDEGNYSAYPPRGYYGADGDRKGPGLGPDGSRCDSRFDDAVAYDELYRWIMKS